VFRTGISYGQHKRKKDQGKGSWETHKVHRRGHGNAKKTVPSGNGKGVKKEWGTPVRPEISNLEVMKGRSETGENVCILG